MAASCSRLAGIVLLVRDVLRSTAFYGPEGLGLAVAHAGPAAAVLRLAPETPEACSPYLTLLAAPVGSEAVLCTGYTPMLTVEVEDVQAALPRLLARGAHMDGAVAHAPQHTAVCLRTPDGHMLGLVERAAQQMQQMQQMQAGARRV